MYPAEFAKKLNEKNIPISASFELTYLCNERCIHCYQLTQQKADGELSAEKIKDILDQLADAGCLNLTFTGGEPLLKKDFWKISEYAFEKSFALQLQTNGTPLNLKVVERIKRLNFLQVHISLLGAKASTHDMITRHNGSFRKVIRAIRLLKERGITVILKATLIKENIHELGELEELSKQLDASLVLSTLIFPMSDGRKDPLIHCVTDPALKRIYSSVGKDLINFFSCGKQQVDDNTPLCGMARTNCCITPLGLVYPCVGLPIVLGDLKKDRFIDIWTKSERLKWLRSITFKDLKDCKSCDLLGVCVRCPGIPYLEQGDILSVSPQICRIARTLKEVINYEKGSGDNECI